MKRHTVASIEGEYAVMLDLVFTNLFLHIDTSFVNRGKFFFIPF